MWLPWNCNAIFSSAPLPMKLGKTTFALKFGKKVAKNGRQMKKSMCISAKIRIGKIDK